MFRASLETTPEIAFESLRDTGCALLAPAGLRALAGVDEGAFEIGGNVAGGILVASQEMHMHLVGADLAPVIPVLAAHALVPEHREAADRDGGAHGADAAHGDMAGSARDFANSTSKMGTKIPLADLQAIYPGTYGDAAQHQIALKILSSHLGDEWAPTMLLQLGDSVHSFDLYEHGHSGLSDAYLNWLWQPEPWSRKARQDPAFQGFAQRIGMVAYWKQNGWPDLCNPAPGKDADAFVCR